MFKKASGALINWIPVSERINQALYHSQHIKLTVVHVHGAPEDAKEQVKNEFYMGLEDELDSRSNHDTLIITMDVNAKLGEENEAYESDGQA